MIKLPGLIDIHVHLRDPGQTYKEDFFTGTQAAIAGGYTTICDMPNNKQPIISIRKLQKKIQIAKKKIVCNVGFYAGSIGKNLDQLVKMEPYVMGLKLYLDKTTGNYMIDKNKLISIFKEWKSNKPILIHTEHKNLDYVIEVLKTIHRRVHICHVSTAQQLKIIINAKKQGLPISCGVTPHHLFLNKLMTKDLNWLSLVKPPIADIQDQNYLWKNIDYIDVIESDHAPHTILEKMNKKNSAFGLPGLETTLPLLLTAMNNKKITKKQILNLCYYNPKKIFKIKTSKNTYILVDEKKEYMINNHQLKTKCHWSPFNGWLVRGKVVKVVIRGKIINKNNQLLVKPGFGRIIN